MKQLWSFLLLVVALVAPSAQSLHAQQTPAVSTKHSLWKVQGKTNSVYLFGSIHFLKKEFYPLPAPIEEAYKKSAVIAFETDIEEMESTENRRKIAQLGKFPEGETLSNHLAKETYTGLNTYLTNSGVPGNALDAFRPWVTAVALLAMELQKLGYHPKQGVDRYFLAKAEKEFKQRVALETPEFQMSLFTELSDEEQEAMLKETLAEISTFEKLLSEMVHAWESGDAEKLDHFILDHMREFPELQKKLLFDRNEKWVGTLEKMLNGDKDAFVVVGAAHLVGSHSVIELLKKKGFKIEQL